MKDVKKILKDIVGINTIADKGNSIIIDYIAQYFNDLDFIVQRKRNNITEKEILIAKYGENAGLGFFGHTDTVDVSDDWRTDPFEMTEIGGNLYGLGTCDMKGGIAAFMAAIASIDLNQLKRGIAVYCTYDEEIMFNGIKDMTSIEKNFPQHIIVAEPTDIHPMTGSKGLLEYIFTFTGITTHSSMPIEGKNSNKNAVRFLSKMLDFELELRKSRDDFFEIPYSTMNIGIINGGSSINKVPDKTTVYMDFRICDSDKEYPLIKKTVDEAIKGLDGSYEIVNDIRSFQINSDRADVYEEITAEKSKPFFGISEASFLPGDRVILGPGPVTAHEKDEHISVKSLERTVTVYKKAIEHFCF